jgi:hypothetical protein
MNGGAREENGMERSGGPAKIEGRVCMSVCVCACLRARVCVCAYARVCQGPSKK